MKLKKIASLALAGVLAVSMLAGCNFENVTGGTGNTTETAPVTSSSAVSLFQTALKSYNPDLKITVKENSSLANAIKTNDDTKAISYADLIGSGVGDELDKYTGLAKTLYTSKDVAAPTATTGGTFKSGTKSTYDPITEAMKVATGATVDTVVCAADFLNGTVANGSQMIVAANTFAQAVKDAKIANTYEDVDSKDWTAEYTVTLYTAEVSNANNESGTVLVMVVETNVEEVKD